MQGIEIPIGAPLDQLTKDLRGAKSKLTEFTSDHVKAAGGLDAFKRSAVTSGQSLQSFSKGSNSAAFALTNLGRVAQDAPFGFIGIQNNLNPLLESFSRLKQETGGTGSALKALGQSLIGPAGLGIALSVVSAGILLYQQYQQRANKATENAKKVTEDYASTLDQVVQAQLKGAQSAVSELTNLKILYAATQDVTLSAKQRNDAVDNLQQKYPAYFKNIKDEVILAGSATAAYNRLSSAILATARARAAEELISENTKKQLENEQKFKDLDVERIKGAKDLVKQKTIERAIVAAGGSESAGALNAEGRQVELINQQNYLRAYNNKLNEKNLDLVKSINVEIKKGADLSGNVGGSIAENKVRQKALRDNARGAGLKYFDESLGLKRLEAQSKKILPSNKPLIPIESIFGNIKAPEIAGQLYTPFQILKDDINFDLLPQLGSSFQTFFDDMLMNGTFSFQKLGESIKKTFISVLASEATQKLLGLLGGVGKDGERLGKGGILSSLGSVLGLGGAAAKVAGVGAGSAGAVAGGTAASGGALLPIIAGIAAVAGIASLFKKKTAPVPVQSNVSTSSSVSSGITSGGGEYVFRIQGNDLIAVLNRAGAKLQRFGP